MASDQLSVSEVRGFGVIAFLDAIFAAVGVFVTLIVIQAALIRVGDPPSEADVYAAMASEVIVEFGLPHAEPWLSLGIAGLRGREAREVFVDRLVSLSTDTGRFVKVEIAISSTANPTRLQLAIDAVNRQGVGSGRYPPILEAWRPLATDEDPAAWVEGRVQETTSSSDE
jgi:hypothetical protein